VGKFVGISVGRLVDGSLVGILVGSSVVGESDGCLDGSSVVGNNVGTDVVSAVGNFDGFGVSQIMTSASVGVLDTCPKSLRPQHVIDPVECNAQL